MKLLKLSNPGIYIKVDDEDYERLKSSSWSIYGTNKYVRSSFGTNLGNFLIGKDGETIDHKNGDIYDYQKENLRFATYTQNLANRRKVGKNPKSKYKGVTFHIRGYFVASITYKSKSKYLGHYNSEIAAAKAYDRAAKEAFKEFARLNFPEVSN